MRLGTGPVTNIGPSRFRRGVIACLLSLVSWTTSGFTADPRQDVTNKGVVELEVDGSAGISVRMAEDLAGLIDDGATRRVLPVIGKSARQNLADLLLLRGVDMAILQTDMLDVMRQQRAGSDIKNSFTYVTKLYNEEFHLLAGPAVKSISDLANKRIDVGIRGSGTSITAGRLFELLKMPVTLVYDPPELALAALRKGDIDAVALVAGKPAPMFQDMPRDGHWHFVPVPLAGDIVNAYLPTSLSADDYPGLVPANEPVDTVAVGSLLAVARLGADTERYRNVSNFVDIFFTQFGTLQEPGHQAKWREINLAADAPGWSRFPPAQAWLDRNAAVAQTTPQDLKVLFTRFLDFRQQALGGKPVTDEEKQELFNEFARWQASQTR